MGRFVQKNALKRSLFAGLAQLATDLNAFRQPHPKGLEQWTKAWHVAASIISSVTGDIPTSRGNTILGSVSLEADLSWATIQYNRTFKCLPVRLGIAVDKTGSRPSPVILPLGKRPNPLIVVGIRLWFDYFNNPEWERLKKCWKCQSWFVDKTKNMLKHFCQPLCSRQWWNRPVRREWKKLKEKQEGRLKVRQSPLTREKAIAVFERLERLKERKSSGYTGKHLLRP
jgi:hypothetical protein